MRIGILGAGQLGRMLALDGYPLGQRFTLYDPSGNPSAGVGDVIPDREGFRLKEFLDSVDCVTYEFEHLPFPMVEKIGKHKPVYPPAGALRVCQNRALEKELFRSLGIPTATFRVVNSAQELEDAARELGCPVVAKSVTEGYDGKGQSVLKAPEDAASAWADIAHRQLIVEAFVPFRRELSIIAVRGIDGETAFYPMAENVHKDGILRYSIAPAPEIDSDNQTRAEDMIRLLLNELEYVGTLALELFETEDALLANEMAPRVHNSGHWTQEGAVTSQFENHIRAISGLPLGDTAALNPTCMINLIGKTGDIKKILKLPYTHLHLYDKNERAGRKLGHINICADSYEELNWRVMNTASLLPDAAEFSYSLTGY